MGELLSQVNDTLQWIGDSPFRLLSALCLFVSCIAYLLFRDQSARYRAFALLLLFLGAAGIGYSTLDQRQPQNSGLTRIQQAISDTITDRRPSGCITDYHVSASSIAASNLDDVDVQTANSIIQDALNTAEYALDERGSGYILGCQPHSIPLRGFTSQCQPAATAFFKVAPDILKGDLSSARKNANLAERIFKTCR